MALLVEVLEQSGQLSQSVSGLVGGGSQSQSAKPLVGQVVAYVTG